MGKVLTVGHSTHDLDHFLNLLDKHGVTAIADIRSVPASRFNAQFNRDALKRALSAVDIQYVFLGRELGARSDDPSCYDVDGRVQYDRLARTPGFAKGIDRLLDGMQSERIALMCAEQEPLDCHRAILVARALAEKDVAIDHIHGDGRLETHARAMHRLLTEFGLDQPDLFHTPDELMAEALGRQEQKIAYVRQPPTGGVQTG